MRTVGHFVSNLKGRDILGLILGLICIGFVLRADFRSGLWTMSIPAMAGAAGLGYALRNVLVDHYRAATIALNGLLAASWVLILMTSKEAMDLPAARVSLAAFIGCYLSCYYLLLSDTRVVRQE